MWTSSSRPFSCRRLLQHSTTAPTASSSKLGRHCDSPPTHGIDAAKLLAATNPEDALKILNQAAPANAFSMSTEATKLMTTLQMSPAVAATTEVPPLRDYVNHMHVYSSYMQNQPVEMDKGSLSRFCSGWVRGEGKICWLRSFIGDNSKFYYVGALAVVWFKKFGSVSLRFYCKWNLSTGNCSDKICL